MSIHWERYLSKAAEVIALRCDVCHRTWTEENPVDDIEYYGRELLANEFRARWGLVEVGKDVGGNVDRCGSCDPKSIFGGTAQTLQHVAKGVYGGTITVTVGDEWTKTPAQHRAERARAIEREKRNASALRLAEACRRTGVELQKLAAQTKSQAEQWRQYERDRFRAAMQGMANVMAGVEYALERVEREDDTFMVRQRHDSRIDLMTDRGGARRRASERWSARVREGVAKLQPPGPRVACQGDWEDD